MGKIIEANNDVTPRQLKIKEFGYFKVGRCSFGNGKFVLLENEPTAITDECVLLYIKNLTGTGYF